MSQIVTITNPITGQPAQVDQLEHTAQEIDDAIARALPGGAIDIALQKKLGGVESTDYPGCYYRMVDGVVEWFNPPMIPGKEYRTTERYQGKPVYAKLVSFGVLPNNTSKSVAHGITELATVLYVNGTIGYGTLLADQSVSSIALDSTNITITTTADLSGFISYVMLKYYKYTD